jgi:hypothetical protein
MEDPVEVRDGRSAYDRLQQNFKDVQALENEIKRLTEARSTLLMESRQLQEFILKSGDEDLINKTRQQFAFRNSTAPKKIPRAVEEKEIFAILRAFRMRSLTEANVVQLAQETYPGRPKADYEAALRKLLLTGEVTKNPDGTITFAIPFHLM